ncbi:hypothetical protein pdam_00019175 [Pocillopora damicornis]|uniref:Uncharacterized protein n=1 Tax=Pocillopora damicornis TaxID=46731 RepID=A0A3M6TGB2_POCDA|nr:hypothetical protein pdam_00019175 [Pocillopora damicornis]
MKHMHSANSLELVDHIVIELLKNGLVVPEKLTAFTKSAAIGQILKEQMNHIVELCKNMEMEITGTEKAILLY